MKKIFLLSDNFDYSRMICNDAGPSYAANMGWEWDTLSNAKKYSDYVNIVDRRITEQDCYKLTAFIATNKDTKFFFGIGDPFKERKRHFYISFLNSIKHYHNVYFLTTYIPSEIVKTLDDSTRRKKMFFFIPRS